MLRAFLFDFDGVIVDNEPLHCKVFQKILKEEGMSLTQEDYYQRYLGYDDIACLQAIFKDQGKRVDTQTVLELARKKERVFKQEIDQGMHFVPGVIEFIRALSNHYYIAIVSGALRSEIDIVLAQAGISDLVSVIVSALDVKQGKPSPEGYLMALRLLNRDHVPASEVVLTQECLVFEDSPWGLQAASSAQMPAVALTTSYDKAKLSGALEWIENFRVCSVAWIDALEGSISHGN